MVKKADSGIEFQIPDATGKFARFGEELQPPNVRD